MSKVPGLCWTSLLCFLQPSSFQERTITISIVALSPLCPHHLTSPKMPSLPFQGHCPLGSIHQFHRLKSNFVLLEFNFYYRWNEGTEFRPLKSSGSLSPILLGKFRGGTTKGPLRLPVSTGTDPAPLCAIPGKTAGFWMAMTSATASSSSSLSSPLPPPPSFIALNFKTFIIRVLLAF